jgi:hypothetical protein
LSIKKYKKRDKSVQSSPTQYSSQAPQSQFQPQSQFRISQHKSEKLIGELTTLNFLSQTDNLQNQYKARTNALRKGRQDSISQKNKVHQKPFQSQNSHKATNSQNYFFHNQTNNTKTVSSS